jgi:TonB family protein
MEAGTQESLMKHHGIFCLVAAFVMFGSVFALAADIKIVANPSVRADSITVAELRSIFLEDKRSLKEGSHVEPVLAKGGAGHEVFLRQYVGRSDDELRTYYRTLVFTGTGAMPKFLDSDAEILHYVATTKGAIGYVSSDFPTEGVKVLTIVQAGTNSDRKLLTRVEPEYPETLKQMQIGGTVRLMVTVSPKGSVDGVQLLGGNPILAEAAIKAVKQWVYAPGPSRTINEVSIPFAPKRGKRN